MQRTVERVVARVNRLDIYHFLCAATAFVARLCACCEMCCEILTEFELVIIYKTYYVIQ